ncbi:MAG: efflux RND transporter periplasmic adaptor subunit [Hydrogenophaga sp.]|jgi:HlyD family secretion protein|uniref:efflux RND transporter periplasmic adaptor subunit n=1 Tax=Hydrogenophaga sp. TaxID=1904254 RepID=UPI0026249068|nr:efflux RND transporter periplasmic adaptor subunit [Hydrogenophaga sp.]MCV0440740.1 efflux RND transporter periplasmic adaptor subunit [Hydrogenophaga sp.]
MNATPSQTPRRKRWIWLALALAAVLLVVFGLVLGQPQDEAPPAEAAPRPSLTVTVARPAQGQLPIRLQANGDISAWQEASVGAEVNGLRLASVNVNVGDVVRKGQVLAVFASETTRADSLQSRASLMQAEASYENARADAERARSIQDSGALSKSQVAQYLTQEKVAHAQFEAAKAAFAATEVRLGNTRVLAPDDGVISARMATVGAVVGAGQELFRLVRQSRMEWRGEVTPSEVGRIRVGQTVNVTAATGLEIAGKVRAIAPSADPQTRNILVFVDLPRHADLKAGTFAKGSFDLGQSEALTVASESIVVRDGSNYVFVIDPQNKAGQRKVQTGRRVGERVEILEGLKADEAVAVQGAGFLNEGDLVKVVQ